MAKSKLSRLLGWMKRTGAESRQFGNYHIVKIVHDGEKAAVYQARSGKDDDLYAIKVYKPHYNRVADRMCRRYHLRTEGEIGISLNPKPGQPTRDHPIVLTHSYGHEFGDSSKCYFLIQEFVDGFNLKHLISCDDAMLKSNRLRIARTVARGISIIHERGLIHRDICTDNVLLHRNGRPKLVDLGFMAPQGLSFREQTGTPSYMSPEQFQARPLFPATDIYSFGAVLFELVAGRPPFLSKFSSAKPELQMRRMSELMDQHIRDAPPRPAEIAPHLPAAWNDLILNCLEKDPAKRPADMREVLKVLSALEEPEAG